MNIDKTQLALWTCNFCVEVFLCAIYIILNVHPFFIYTQSLLFSVTTAWIWHVCNGLSILWMPPTSSKMSIGSICGAGGLCDCRALTCFQHHQHNTAVACLFVSHNMFSNTLWQAVINPFFATCRKCIKILSPILFYTLVLFKRTDPKNGCTVKKCMNKGSCISVVASATR